jgi:hypothetical protein
MSGSMRWEWGIEGWGRTFNIRHSTFDIEGGEISNWRFEISKGRTCDFLTAVERGLPPIVREDVFS